MKIATANIKATLSDTAADIALRRVLQTHPDVVCLQEWGNARRRLLDRLPASWDDTGNRRPILWNRNRLTFEGTHVAILAPGGRVSKLPGRRAVLGNTIARVSLFVRPDGSRVAVVNYHLPAAVETGGRPRPSSGAGRLQQHATAVVALAALWQAYDQAGYDTYAAGDSNVDHRLDARVHHPAFPAWRLNNVGAVSCWDGHFPAPRDGTHHARLIDGVWADRPASTVRQITTASDHDAVVVTYPTP